MNKIYKKNKGQSLVEMVVVIGVVMLLVTGIVSGMTSSLARTKTVSQRSSAIKYAQQGIELTRAQRDAGWSTFAALGSVQRVYCVGSDGAFTLSGGSCSVPNIEGLFVRSVTLYLPPATPTKMSVKVIVSWGDTSRPENTVTFDTYLTKWQ